MTPEETAALETALARRLSLEERRRLEELLLQRLRQHKPALEQRLKVISDHWTYEDHFYRFYQKSFRL